MVKHGVKMADVLNKISLICANFGNHDVFEIILQDWFAFLGGKPGEVVVVDGGSDQLTQNMYLKLYNEGKIDKLQLIKPAHPDNDKSRCYIQEYNAAMIASKPYLLFYKTDTFPFRDGLETWLEEAVQYLDQPDIFAVSGAFNWNSKTHDAWPGWFYTQICTENFALMKKETFVKAMREFAGEFIDKNFAGENPAGEEGKNGRFLLEIGFNWYMKKHNIFTLVHDDNQQWTVIHTNLKGRKLLEWRGKFYQRKGLGRHFRQRALAKEPYAVYYGHSAWFHFKRHSRIALGRSRFGALVRAIKLKAEQLKRSI